jgi:formamidopyrimidine-DNA glycosylase
MPELPEVETVRRSLAGAIIGRRIAGVRIGDFQGVIGDTDPRAFSAALVGAQIEAITRRGKYLSLQLDNGGSLVIHLRMTGNLVLVDPGTPPLRFEHLAIVLDDGRELRFADQRKFGRVLFLPGGDRAYLRQRLGIEPLAPSFTAARLGAILARRTAPVKSVLLDQSSIAGIGNIYADEALFLARVHPLRPASSLDAHEVRRLHRAIRRVLNAGITHRGTSFSHFVDGQGESGENQNFLRVYGRGRKAGPCPRCGRPLSLLVIGGRSSHLCEHCQPPPV